MGGGTLASGESSTAMGDSTTASGLASTAMGFNTTASGIYSTAMGRATTASGNTSVAMGFNVSTNGHEGSFIYGDAHHTRAQGLNSEDNQFSVIATGGIRFYLSPDYTSQVYIKAGDAAWSVTSDRNAKTSIEPVNPKEVLAKVLDMPVSTWRYKSQDEKYRHMGAMAQDFYAAFGLGDSDKSISTVDADGVALAAIQGLNARLAEQEAKAAAQLEALRAEKNREIAALRSEKNDEMAALRAELSDMKTQLAALRTSSPASTTVALRQP